MSAAVSEAPAPPLLQAPPITGEPPDMNAEGEGATPLMYACQQARDVDLKVIIGKKPAAVRERDRTQKSALHYCAETPSVSCAETVLAAAPELLDSRDEDGYTTLHLAVIAGNCPLIRLLLSRGADANCLDNERHSVVHWATVCGEVEALEAVLGAGAASSSPDMHGGYPLHYAAQMCGPGGERGGGRLGLAVLRTLLAHGVEVNVTDQDGRQPILWAASAGSADAILSLVNAGANVEADDKDGLTALHCAASRGHTDCLETLISLCGAAVDVMDSNGCTALFYAVTLGHADATQLLLEHGAQPNRQDRKGRTPAHCGAAKGQLETLRILSSRGANMWARNVKGDYPLHEAVSSGRKSLVRWLLAQRPDAVNASNNDGRCPLHIAAVNNNVEMCKIVLDHESLVNPVMRTSKGGLMTPLDAALYKGNRGCAKYMQLHGGVPATKLTSQSAALRGVANRGDPHSDQVTTPEWGPNLAVPEMRGAQSLGHSPVELAHKHLTVVDATRTLEVRVEDELLHRRGSESSTDDKVRRRRRKRRPKREGSEVETDSSGRQARRRRRRRKDHEDTSDEESEVESRRRRRRSRKGKASEESGSEDTSKRKRKEGKYRRKRSVSSDRGKEDTKKEKSQENDSDKSNEGTKSNNEDDDVTDSKSHPQENRRVLKEEITTKEVTKSKKVIEHKEKEKSSSKPTVTKTSKMTHEETKTEEQITTKTSEIISTPPDNKGDEISTQESQGTPTQQVVTAIVHQEESTEQAGNNMQSTDHENLEENSEEKAAVNGETAPDNKDTTQKEKSKDESEADEQVENGENAETKKEEVNECSPEESSKNKEETSGDKTPDIVDFWDDEVEIKKDVKEKEASGQQENNIDESENKETEEKEAEDNQESVQAPEDGNTNEESLGNQEDIEIERVENNETLTQDLEEKKETAEVQDQESAIQYEVNEPTKPTEELNADEEETGTPAADCVAEDEGIEKTSLEGQQEDPNKDENETNPAEEEVLNTDQEENKKGLIKVLGRSEVDDENLKGVVKVEKINSDALKDRGRARESRGRRRTSSFEIVSPARSLPDEEIDSETPRSRSRTGADSSQLQDSGFEPSPRRDSKRSSRIPRACRNRRSVSHSRAEADSEDDRPPLSTVSVTQAVQHSMRKYHLERRIFHELLELKRLQIRAGRANEAVLVKRLVDDYRRAGLCIGLKPYEGVFTFRAFEKYLYDQLRLLQSSDRRVIPRLKATDDLEQLTRVLRHSRAGNTLLDNVPQNPILCTHGTHRCYHATHAYTGVPCAAYIAKINHHTMPKPSGPPQPSFLPRIDSGKQRVDPNQGAEIARCLRYVDPSRPVTLELSHGQDRQVISLPTEKLDKNKRYYVTFTIKGGEATSAEKQRHQHAKSF